MKNKPYKRFLAFLLCAAMLITYMPSTAFTFADEGSDDQQTVEEAKPAAPAAEKKVEKKEEKKEEAKAEKAPAPATEEKVETPDPEPKAEEPADTPKEEPAEKPEASGDETRAGPEESEPVKETAEEPAEEVSGEAVDETAEEAVEETAEEALEETGEEVVDEEALEEEEEEGDEEDAEKEEFPPFGYDKQFGSVHVYIDAPKGALPDGVRVQIDPVEAVSVEDAVEDLMGENTSVITAFDITFYDKDGKEFKPNESVKVRFVSDKIDAAENPTVLHIKENGAAEMADNGKVSSDTASFRSDDFSIYVVVDPGSTEEDARATVVFKSGSSEVATVYVKNKDTAADLETIIYDPGIGDTDMTGKVFRGWDITTDEDASYTTETVGKDIQDVRDYFKDLTIAEGSKYYVHAVIYDAYTVTYKDPEGAVLETKTVLSVPGSDTPEDFEINLEYTPADPDTQQFQGWFVSGSATHEDGSAIGETEALMPGTTILVSGTVTLTAKAPTGNWLIFRENGKGASYTPSQFLEGTAPAVRPENPTRYGYNFVDWYTGHEETVETGEVDENGDPISEKKIVLDEVFDGWGEPITKKTILYAGWEAKETAPYTVMIWKQKSSGSGYDFAASYSGTGAVGTSVLSSAIPAGIETTGDLRYVTVGGTKYGGITSVPAGTATDPFTGFTLKSGDITDATINAEGTAVVNVYFDRVVYTLRFYLTRTNNAGTGNYIGSSATGTVFSGNWNTNLTYITQVNGSAPTTFISQGGYRYYYYSIEAPYGASIADKWINQSNITSSTSFVSWLLMPTAKAYTGSGQGRDTVKGLIGIMDEQVLGDLSDTDGNYVTARYGGYNSWTYHIYFADENGDYPATESTRIDVRSNGTNAASQHAPAYEGYTNDASLTRKGTGYDMYFYYTRNKYDINFMDGAYVDGNGSLIQNKNKIPLEDVKDITYGADISSYNNKKPGLPEGEAGYVFEGWYIDEACNTKYTFETMPIGGLTVYAKWRQIQYRVFLDPKTDDTSLQWEGQNTSFRVTYGARVNIAIPVRDDFEFMGWYYGDDKLFSQDAYPINQAPGLASYSQTENTELDKYGNVEPGKEGYNSDAANDRFWITQKLNLYAKWRAKTTGQGIQIIYDANGGTNAPTDESFYKDQTNATARPASTPADPEKEQFLYWTIQKWVKGVDGAEGHWEDTDEQVYPADTFLVEKTNAKEEKTTDAEGVETTSYTIQLKAEYGPLSAETPTHIWWFKNDGTEAFRKDEKLKINQKVAIPDAPTRTGYVFKGWARVPIKVNGSTEDVTEEQARAWEASSDNWTQTGLTAEVTYDSTSGYSAESVAADEHHPYHAMFGVWEVGKYDITVTKTFDGIDALPSDFKITYTDGKETPVYSGTLLPSAVSVEGKTYTWTIEDVAYDTALTFTESGYEKDSYSVTAEAKATVGETTTTGTDSVTMTVGEENKVEFTNTYVEQNPELTIEKKADTKSFSNVGDVITWTITATNSGDVTLNNVEVTDKLTGVTLTVASSSDVEAVISGLKATAEKLEPNQSLVLTASYTVTQKDLDNDKVSNAVSAKSDEDTPKDPPASEIPADQTKKLGISKTPITESYKEVGEEISWKITAENKGNVTLNNVEVTDKLNGVTLTVDESSDATPTIDGAKATIAKLGPGRKIVLIATYTVTQADIDAGKVSNAVSAKSDEDTPDDPPPSDIPADQNKALKVTKTANPSSDVDSGDVITYTVVVENTGNVKITGIKLTDSLVTLSEEAFDLEPGAKKTVTYTYTVTDADVTAGRVTNTATAAGKDPKGEDVTGSMTVNTPTKQPQPEPPVPGTPKLEVEKTSDVAEGTKVKLGDVINYKVTVKNVGEVDLTGITVEDSLVPIEDTPFDLAIGATKEFNYSYTVTQADVDKGKVYNHVTASGGDTEDDDDITIPTEDPNPEVTVTKTASPSSGATEGTTIKYTIVVENTGNVTVSNINVSDSLVNVNVEPFTLAPGEKKTIKYSYKVTAADVEAGSVSNTATATGTDPSGDDTPPGTDTVVVTTEEDDDDDDTPTPTPTPTPPAPAGPAGPAPGGPGVVPAAPVVDGTPIADEPVPEAEPEVEIPDEPAPLAEGTWALLNLIAAILTTLGAIVALFRKKEEEDEDEEDQNKPKTDEEEEDEDDNRGKKMLAAKIAGAVAGVVSPIVFFLTEDMSLPMALIDKWTLLMAVFLVAQIAAAVFNKKASELDDEEEEEEAEPAN